MLASDWTGGTVHRIRGRMQRLVVVTTCAHHGTWHNSDCCEVRPHGAKLFCLVAFLFLPGPPQERESSILVFPVVLLDSCCLLLLAGLIVFARCFVILLVSCLLVRLLGGLCIGARRFV